MDAVRLGFGIDEVLEKGLVSKRDLETLQRWQTENGLPQLVDEQLYLFLASCDGDVDRSKDVIRVYFKHKASCTTIFNDRNVTNMEKTLNVLNIAVMPNDYKGRTLLVSFLNDSNYRNFDYESSLKLMCMTFESISYECATSEVILIVDCQKMGFMHLFKIKINLVIAFIDYIQQGMPLKINRIHVVNTNGALLAFHNMLKRFIRHDLLSKIVFHSVADSDVAFYKNWIPRKYLPKELGGNLNTIHYYKELMVKKLKKMQPYFDAEEKQREC